ncbi:MAG: hypothetical protein WD225_01850 [Ilumatobacteraceae bacterium]
MGLFWLVATAWRPWRLFDRAGFSADFHDEQARALLHGRLHVDPVVADIEGFLVDGRTYLYYGPAPAIARLPTATIDRLADTRIFDGRLALVSMLVALVVLATWSYRLLDVGGRIVRGRTGAGERHVAAGPWRTAGFVGVALGSPVLFLAGWISVYHETELWACTTAVIAAVCLLEILRHPGAVATRWWAGAAAATVATVLTRVSVGIGVALAATVVAGVVARRDVRAALGLLVAAVGSVGLHVMVNLVRFGSLLDLPADRQVLTLRDPERAAWFAGNDGSFFSLRFLPTTVLQYLRPDTIRFERLLPGVRFGPLAPDVGSYPVETTTPASSLTAAAPVLVALAVVGLVWLVRRRRWTMVAVVVALAVGAAPSFLIGFIANRYLVDALPGLLVPAAVGIWAVPRLPAVRLLVAATVVWGLWVNASLGTWALGLKSPGFHELRYRVDAAVFPPPRPGLIGFDRVPGRRDEVPRDGVVALGAGCAGVYVAEQGRWVALDRAEGRRVLTGEVISAGTLVDAGRWSIELPRTGADSTLVLRVDDAPVAEVAAGPLDAGDRVRVVADPVVGELSVTTASGTVLFDPEVPAPADVLIGIDLRVGPPATPSLCEALVGLR